MSSDHRVVITGVGVISPLGQNFVELGRNLFAGKSSVVRIPQWKDECHDLMTEVGSPVIGFDELQIPRKYRRTMTRVAMMSFEATKQALEDARLSQELISNPRTGIAYGSCMGGTSELHRMFEDSTKAPRQYVSMATSATYLKAMPQTCAANLAVAFEIPGRIIASSSACAASTQAIGFGYEAIKHGLVERMICGGAEEFSGINAAIFEVLRATSIKYNQEPQRTPRPFDKDRDGIVVGEGAGTFVLENRDLALKRGAKIYAEISGFYTNNDACHMTNPSVLGLVRAMQGALDDAGLKAADIDYINAHATATDNGDLAEAQAIYDIFGSSTPVSSTKGHFGHLLGATGIVECMAAITMMDENKVLPTLNLEHVDPGLANINLVREVKAQALNHILKNSFAFGGINATLILSRPQTR